MQGSGASLLFLATVSVASGQADDPLRRGDEPFAVGAFRTELAADDPVGRKKAGLICGPAGTLRWRDVEPVAGKASGAAARVIRDAGVQILAPAADDWIEARTPTTGYRLIGDIVGMAASVCAPAYGAGRQIDHGRRLKGNGRMRVTWRIYRLADHRVVAETETCAAFGFDRPGMAPANIGQLAVIENARVLGAALARTCPSFALPASLIAEEGSCPPYVRRHRTPDGTAYEP